MKTNLISPYPKLTEANPPLAWQSFRKNFPDLQCQVESGELNGRAKACTGNRERLSPSPNLLSKTGLGAGLRRHKTLARASQIRELVCRVQDQVREREQRENDNAGEGLSVVFRDFI